MWLTEVCATSINEALAELAGLEEAQALRSVLFVSRTPRARCVQCHQPVSWRWNNCFSSAASLSTGMQLCFFGGTLEGRSFSKPSPPVVNLHCTACSLLERLEFQPPTPRVQWHKNPPTFEGWSCNQLYLRAEPFYFTQSLGWNFYPQTRPCGRGANAGKQLSDSKQLFFPSACNEIVLIKVHPCLHCLGLLGFMASYKKSITCFILAGHTREPPQTVPHPQQCQSSLVLRCSAALGLCWQTQRLPHLHKILCHGMQSLRSICHLENQAANLTWRSLWFLKGHSIDLLRKIDNP